MARPKKQEEESRNKILQVRLTDAEYQAFQDAADSSGLPLSGWVRQQLRNATREQLRKKAKQYLDPKDLK